MAILLTISILSGLVSATYAGFALNAGPLIMMGWYVAGCWAGFSIAIMLFGVLLALRPRPEPQPQTTS
ncbi:hypothetical protein ACXYMO_17640 [Arenibacterium sp. CAU 1754]